MEITGDLFGLGRPLAYYPSMERLTGDVTSALFLSEMLVLTRKTTDKEGWFYINYREICWGAGLSRYRWRSSRKVLRHLGVLEEKYAECPRRLFFRLNLDRLECLFSVQSANQFTGEGSKGLFLVDGLKTEKTQQNQQCVEKCPTSRAVSAPLDGKSAPKTEKTQQNQQCVEKCPTGRAVSAPLDGESALKTEKTQQNQQCVEKCPTDEAAYVFNNINTNILNKNKIHTQPAVQSESPEKRVRKKTANRAASSSRSTKSSKKTSNPAVKRLVDWYYGSWNGTPPEKVNGNGYGRVGKIFKDLFSYLADKQGLSVSPEEYIKNLYGFYRSAKPVSRDEQWLFGDEVKSLVRFRGKFAYIEGKYLKRKPSSVKSEGAGKYSLEAFKPSVKKDWGVPEDMLARNKRPLFSDFKDIESNKKIAGGI